MHMQEEDTLDQYVGKLNSMSVKYANLGATLDDAALVKKLFDTVPDHFLSVIARIEQFHDLNTMSFEEAVGWLKTYEERARTRASSGSSVRDVQLLLTQAEWQARQKKDSNDSSLSSKGKFHAPAENSNRGGGGHVCGRGHGRDGRGGASRTDKESDSSDGHRNKSHIKCYNCYKMGHYANECMAPKKKEETHLTRTDDTELALLLAMSEEVLGLQQRQDAVLLNEEKLTLELRDTMEGGSSSKVWYLNNGANNKMTSDKEKFRELDEGVTSKMMFGDGSTV
ncbi:uncharacterized protein LOC133887309 [Phragmites australis]|uniref:uncharacterized protein LOC133887309 n=1 Tax=Phragmites australis TaxID=29695 RepID=UPI002D79CD25|nr:uncharacterized protein LOC133887309 [Phragmites australis]